MPSCSRYHIMLTKPQPPCAAQSIDKMSLLSLSERGCCSPPPPPSHSAPGASQTFTHTRIIAMANPDPFFTGTKFCILLGTVNIGKVDRLCLLWLTNSSKFCSILSPHVGVLYPREWAVSCEHLGEWSLESWYESWRWVGRVHVFTFYSAFQIHAQSALT